MLTLLQEIGDKMMNAYILANLRTNHTQWPFIFI